MLLKDFISDLSSALSSLYPSGEAKAVALKLCEERLGVRSYTHIIEPLFEIPSDREKSLLEEASRLAAGEPVQYVLGYASFCSHKMKVNPSVLIPRPETEQLCNYIIWLLRSSNSTFDGSGLRILDLCTGSGCIAWTMAAAFPGAEVVGVDISAEALKVASSQEVYLPSGNQVPPPSFIQADVLSPDFDPGALFDVIISNPPYVRESEKSLMRSNVLDFEPSLALFVPDGDPLVFYRAIASCFKRITAPDALGFFEINEAMGPSVADILVGEGLGDVNVMKDVFDRDRFVLCHKSGSVSL